MADKFKHEWIKPIDENVLWICQLPRSGGTLLLRLLDCHPEIHGYPAVIGFSNKDRIWPSEQEFNTASNVRDEVFSYMNLKKFHLKGIKKQSSNMMQETYPVYFNGRWYRDIFDQFLKGNSQRNYFDAFFTATFNSWRNYQNLYGTKKYIAGQMTLRKPELYRENYDNFKKAYLEGKMVFILRRPDDWLASAIKLKVSTPFSKNPYEVMDYYKTVLRQAVQMAKDNFLTIFMFEELILNPEKVMRLLVEEIKIQWDETLLRPTFNGAPFYQNSSFELERKSTIDPNVIGRGKLLDKKTLMAVDDECISLYEQIKTHALL